MAKSERIILLCDLCEKDENEVSGVQTRRLVIDRIDIEAEVCTACWGRAIKALVPLSKVGRPVKARRSSTVRALTAGAPVHHWPETDWIFTSHAIQRIGERHLDPAEVIAVVEGQHVQTPARNPEAMIRTANGIKVVVVPARKIIVTAARKDGDLETDQQWVQKVAG